MKIVLILWSALGLSAGVFAASYDSFRPGAEWLDTDGNPIQAHGGSIITVGDTHYWYGENKAKTDGVTRLGSKNRLIWHRGVNLYARYVWLPVVFKDGCPTLSWKDEWKLEDYK